MKIDRSFYIRVNEDGTQAPIMEFFPPRYSMLTHLGYNDFAKSTVVKNTINRIEEALLEKSDFSFASDDWCIVEVLGVKSIITNGFGEYDAFEIETSFIINLLKDWFLFLEKYENNKIPGLICK